MNRKLVGILVCGLLIASAIPVIGAGINCNSNIENEPNKYFMIDAVRYNIIDNKYIFNQNIESCNYNNNLLLNPSFENGTGNLPDYWNHDPINNSESYIWEDTQSYSGKKSVAITHLTEMYQFTYWHSASIPVDLINNKYILTVYYKFSEKPNRDQGCNIGFDLYDKNKIYLGGYAYGLPTSTEWKQSYTISTLTIWDQVRPKIKYIEIFLAFWNTDYDISPPDPVLPNPDIEVYFDDVYFGLEENHPPLTPIIEGPISDKIRTELYYNITIEDPDNDELDLYVDWGDGTNTTIINWYASPNDPIIIRVNHTWEKKGTYIIKAKCTDGLGSESDWATLEVKMPYSYNKPMLQLFELLFQRFINAFPLLRHLMGY